MRKTIKYLSDKALHRVLGEEDAGACYPQENWTTCYNHALMSCFNNCAGEAFCHQIGSC